MITPAKRTELVNEYYFSVKLEQIAQMNKTSSPVLNMGIGSPDMLPPKEALEVYAAEVLKPGNHAYQSYKGLPELRKAYSNWYKQFFLVNLNPDNEILPLIGSKEGIMHISMAYLDPGDKVLIPNPGYPTYRSVTLLIGAEPVDYNLKYENNWYPDFEELEKTDLSGVKIMWVNYPHMPTGQPASMEIYQKLIDFGRKHNILICNDNPYSFILNDSPKSILAIEGAKDVALELNSMSKSHNFSGARLGLVAGKAEYINTVLKVKSNMDSGQYKPMQLAAVKALECGWDWYQAMNKVYADRRASVFAIYDYLGMTYDVGQTGMFVWARIPDSWESSYALSDFYLAKARVFITPGAIFGSNGDRFARISLCSPVEVYLEALARIKNV
jgi:LL-diaminopimelate aminotransferase